MTLSKGLCAEHSDKVFLLLWECLLSTFPFFLLALNVRDLAKFILLTGSNFENTNLDWIFWPIRTSFTNLTPKLSNQKYLQKIFFTFKYRLKSGQLCVLHPIIHLCLYSKLNLSLHTCPVNLHPDIKNIRWTWYFLGSGTLKKIKLHQPYFFSGSGPYFFCMQFAI